MSEIRWQECQTKPHYFEMFLGETTKPCNRPGPIKPPETNWDQPTRCQHLGPEVDSVSCTACGGNSLEYPVRECAIHGLCTEHERSDVIDFCFGCPDHEPVSPIPASPELPFAENRPIKSWAVGITTAPRTKHRTLPECVDSVIRNGWEPILFAEPGTDLRGLPDVEIVQRPRRLGVWHNWKSAARELLHCFPDAEAILTIQDDTVFHPQARWFAEHNFDIGGNRLFSFYTPRHYGMRANVIDENGKLRRKNLAYESARRWMTPTRIKAGWTMKPFHKPVGVHRVFTGSLWGACALAFPRNVLKAILDHKICKKWLGSRGRMDSKKWKARQTKEPWRIQNSDTAIGKAMNALGVEFYCPVPSLAEHIAIASADGVNHGDNSGRRSSAWFAAGDLRETFKA